VPLDFVEQEPIGPQVAGDVGGDYQSTEAFSRRFAARLADGTYAMITLNVFGEYGQCDRSGPKPIDGMYGIMTMTEYMIVTDVISPGSTELHGENAYDDSTLQSTEVTDDQARAVCAALPGPTVWPARLAWQLPAPVDFVPAVGHAGYDFVQGGVIRPAVPASVLESQVTAGVPIHQQAVQRLTEECREAGFQVTEVGADTTVVTRTTAPDQRGLMSEPLLLWEVAELLRLATRFQRGHIGLSDESGQRIAREFLADVTAEQARMRAADDTT
jgi:hypothetical protein